MTSTLHTGDLGGVAGADAICNARAAEASLPGPYMAWIASTTGNAPEFRFVKSSIPYILRTGARVAIDWADLTDGALVNSIDVDETGEPIPVFPETVWTNVKTDGFVTSNGFLNCTGWTDEDFEDGRFGKSNNTDALWTDWSLNNCGNPKRIYCFEQ